jgi:hypothetical protein
MSDIERELQDILERDEKFDPARAELLRLQVTSEFQRKKKRLLILCWVWQAISVAFLLPGVSMVFSGNNHITTMAQGIALIVMGESGLVLIKLWYWIIHGRLEIIREIKRFELRMMAATPVCNPPPEKAAS